MTVSRNAPRIATLDVIRGFAVCGILAMNIVSMGEPGYAYVDPNYYGGAHGADLAAWAIAYVLVDGKMRALFTMLFGASLLLITDAAEDRTPGPARVHYARIFWLFAFGMLHAWFVWYGDILVEYAICGAIAFFGRNWRPSALAFAALCLIGFDAIQSLVQWHDMGVLHRLATGPNPPADAVREWHKVLTQVVPDPAAIARELRLYHGGLLDVFAARAPMTWMMQSAVLPAVMPGTLGFVLLGMLLYRVGFWTGDWSPRAYRWVIASGGLALLLYAPLVRAIVTHRFDPAFLPLADVFTLLLRPFLALAYAAGLIVALQAGAARWLTARLAAAGRMAFSNYLGTSLIMTTIFYGYGLGLFGLLSRAQLYLLVLGQWLLILGWSQPWLRRFRYGPFEWAWRSLSRGEAVSFRKAIAS
ncbi:DUF418 domain-containing protein [Sphingomonas crusticola]|uniref:DUF418 domain-containing protein n=1 Tax=Sphingomonas crusticola TaxID=1697973 RepID=UPI000E287E32|nr:DUF418 domain-containing protein [Sphingomonas crusticola]